MSVLWPVSVKVQVKDWSKGLYTLDQNPEGGYQLWHMLPNTVPYVVATCGKAKTLSEWALDKGAKEVAWDMDLRIVERNGG